MLPEVGALEYLIIAAVALIVVGPKDLPMLLRRLGQFVAKLRGMASEFRASFDEMARQSELDELRKEVEAMRRAQFTDVAAQAGGAEVHDTFSDIDRGLAGLGSDGMAAEPAAYHEAPSEPAPLIEPAPTKPAKPRAKRAAATGATTAKTPAKPRARKAAEPKA